MGLGVSSALSPPVKMPSMASPRPPSSPPSDSDGDGDGSAASAPGSSRLCGSLLGDSWEAEGLGAGPASSSEPESDEEVPPAASSAPLPLPESSPDSPDSPEADVSGSGLPSSPSSAPSVAEGEAEADGSFSASSRAATQSLYSSAVRLLEVGFAVSLPSARASVGVNPIPMRTAVGIAARAIAFPAGMWNLVNNGFLGAAWRGPVLTRNDSTSVPRVTSSAGTVPPVRPVGRARS